MIKKKQIKNTEDSGITQAFLEWGLRTNNTDIPRNATSVMGFIFEWKEICIKGL